MLIHRKRALLGISAFAVSAALTVLRQGWGSPPAALNGVLALAAQGVTARRGAGRPDQRTAVHVSPGPRRARGPLFAVPLALAGTRSRRRGHAPWGAGPGHPAIQPCTCGCTCGPAPLANARSGADGRHVHLGLRPDQLDADQRRGLRVIVTGGASGLGPRVSPKRWRSTARRSRSWMSTPSASMRK